MLKKKIIILGSFAVGKTSLLNRYVLNEFSEDYRPTIGVNIKSKSEIVDNKTVELVIWDIADVVTHNNIPTSYLSGTHAAILVFDITRPETYRRIHDDYKGLKKYLEGIEILIIGNKMDLVDADELEKIKTNTDFKIDFFSSTLLENGNNVNQIFETLATLFAAQ